MLSSVQRRCRQGKDVWACKKDGRTCDWIKTEGLLNYWERWNFDNWLAGHVRAGKLEIQVCFLAALQRWLWKVWR